MLLEEQLYLLTCVFASKADTEKIKLLARRFKDSLEFINALIIFWPELSDPSDFKFLFNPVDGTKVDTSNDEGLVVSLISGDSDLIAMTELDSVDIYNRFNLVKNYVDTQLKNLNIKDKEVNWLIKRIIYCNEKLPENTLFYRALWDVVNIEDQYFQNWLNNVLIPLDHINTRLNKTLRVKQFMDMKPADVFLLIFNSREMITNDEITTELLPYMNYHKSDSSIYSEFLNEYYDKSRFPLDKVTNIEIFKTLYDQFTQCMSDPTKVYEKTLDIIFINSGNSINESELIKSILKDIPESISLSNYKEINSLKLLQFSKYISDSLQSLSLLDIFSITQEKESAQLSHFSSICRENIVTRGDEKALNELKILLNEEKSNQIIFNKLQFEQELSTAYETILSLGKFEMLQNFSQSDVMSSLNDTMKISLLLKYFWQFFNNSTNGNHTRPDMVKCHRILELLPKGEQEKRLKALLEVSDELSNYSLSMKSQTVFKPSNIFDFQEKPTNLIGMLLERNDKLYLSIDITSKILDKVNAALDISVGSKDIQYSKLMAMHIDYSLVNFDFNYAYGTVLKLLKHSDIEELWDTILQVGKFRDPNWVDNEIPTEIIFLQLGILSQLLEVCPVEDVEIVTTQWSELEIEIASRDLMNDKYSIKNNVNGTQKSVFSNLFI